MRLTIRSGSAAGMTVDVTGERFLIGRGGECDLVLNDDKVSRRHTVLRPLDGDGLLVTDLGSRNGTYVNGQRIAGDFPLSPHDQVRIGDTVLEAAVPKGLLRQRASRCPEPPLPPTPRKRPRSPHTASGLRWQGASRRGASRRAANGFWSDARVTVT